MSTLRLNPFRTTLKNARKLGTDLVEMSSHPNCCAECAKYQGRIYSVSGKDTRFPPLPKQVFVYGGIHPGCRHDFYPIIYGISVPSNPLSYSTVKTLAPQWLKIAEESAKLCNETVNPDVFFSRFDLMLEKLRQLAEIEHLVSFSGELPSISCQRIQKQRPAAIHDMIERSYNRMIQEARALKTKKGQDNKLVKYFTTMNAYSDQIGPDGMAYLQSLMERHIVR